MLFITVIVFSLYHHSTYSRVPWDVRRISGGDDFINKKEDSMVSPNGKHEGSVCSMYYVHCSHRQLFHWFRNSKYTRKLSVKSCETLIENNNNIKKKKKKKKKEGKNTRTKC
jgi:hypothetical protein